MSSYLFKQPRMVRVKHVDAKYLTHYHWKVRMVPASPPNQEDPSDQCRYVLKLLSCTINSLKYEFRGISQLN